MMVRLQRGKDRIWSSLETIIVNEQKTIRSAPLQAPESFLSLSRPLKNFDPRCGSGSDRRADYSASRGGSECRKQQRFSMAFCGVC